MRECLSMEFFVGTSGWAYDWNEGGNLNWYIMHSGLNAVELNASFYRFPFKNQILGWSRKGQSISWAVKVHRGITHIHQFSEAALELWEKFREAFLPLDPVIDFYLFQAPPWFSDTERLINFSKACELGERFALEIRNSGILYNDSLCRHLQDCVTLVSVDSPVIQDRIFRGNTIYLRMHGRNRWYQYHYSDEELKNTARILRDLSSKRAFVFFNNNHAMLENARRMNNILKNLQ